MLSKKPIKVNLDKEKLLATRAFKKAQEPDIVVTLNPSFIVSSTKTLPGSLTRGYPASLIKAISLPSFKS